MVEIHNKPSMRSPKPIRTITPHERIQEVNEIDTSIASLLHSAGTAIQILGSNPKLESNDLATAKSAFLSSITTYFTTLSSIDVRLRRQVYALQEAGLIEEGDVRDGKRGASNAASTVGVGAGAGQLDLSWLSGRGDGVERDMEREVWRRAREFVDGLVEREGGQANHQGVGEVNGRVEEGGKNEEEEMRDANGAG